jgi:putative MATE family efflux protein
MADDASSMQPVKTTSIPPEVKPPSGDAAEGAHGKRGRRSAYATRDLTKGSIRKNLWFLGWPQVAEGFLSVADQLADLIWAGRLGFQAIAGLGVAQTYLMLVMTARMGLDSGMRSMIARAVGARNLPLANHILLQSLTLTTFMAAIIATLGILLTEPLLRIIGLSDEVVREAAGYMRIQFVAMSMMGYQRLTAGALQASGDSLTPLKAATVTRVTHLVLSPLLIFGWLGLPAFGLAGAGVARLAAEFLGVGINFYALIAGTSRLRLRVSQYRLDLPLMWSLVKIGAPASVTNMQRGVSQLAVVGIAAQFGDAALAAFALSRRTENIVNQSGRGMGRAAGALAGQNLGAELPERAKSSIKWALVYVTGLTLPVVIVTILFPEPVAAFFNSDPEFVSLASTWLIIAAIGYIFMSPVQVFTQAFNTSGSTMAPMLITLATMWVFDIPLAFILSNYTSLGQFGVPWAIATGTTVRLLFYVWYYLTGKWLRTGLV